MAATAVIGADVIIKYLGTAIAGQRGAKLSGGNDMIDMSCKPDFPDKVWRKGWNGQKTLECDCLLMSGGDYSYAFWYELADAGEEVEIVITIGDGDGTVDGTGGDTGTCNALVEVPEFDAPQDKEATMALKFTINGAITWS